MKLLHLSLTKLWKYGKSNPNYCRDLILHFRDIIHITPGDLLAFLWSISELVGPIFQVWVRLRPTPWFCHLTFLQFSWSLSLRWSRFYLTFDLAVSCHFCVCCTRNPASDLVVRERKGIFSLLPYEILSWVCYRRQISKTKAYKCIQYKTCVTQELSWGKRDPRKWLNLSTFLLGLMKSAELWPKDRTKGVQATDSKLWKTSQACINRYDSFGSFFKFLMLALDTVRHFLEYAVRSSLPTCFPTHHPLACAQTFSVTLEKSLQLLLKEDDRSDFKGLY